MTCAIKNQSNYDTSKFEPLVQDLYQFADQRFGFKQPPAINFVSDEGNHPLLGKTGYYDPNSMEITIFVDDRHPKDMMRSISHELVHHMQNEKGMFDRSTSTGAQYAQKDPHLRKMEAEAYLKGNMCFRDWEDGYKAQHKDIFYERRIYKMSINKWKTKELNGLLNERWGFSMDLGKLNERKIEEEVPKHNPEEHGEIKVKDGPGDMSITDKGKMVRTEAEEDAKDKKPSDLEAEILGVLEAEGGAAGMEALEKELDASKDQIRKEIKDSDKMEKHRDGDIIDITGLDGHDDEEDDQSEAHCGGTHEESISMQERKIRKAAKEAIRRLGLKKRK